MDTEKIKKAIAAVVCVLLLALATFTWNYLPLQAPLNEVLEADPRNEGVTVNAHFAGYFQPSTLTFDLREVSAGRSPADVFRILLQFASRIQEHEFETVQLSYRGEIKFLLRGGYFKQLGREYNSQNPVYTMRTFPENVLLPNGESAYGTWTGGWLGVLGEQMDDFNDFHRNWYLGELTGAQ